MLELGGKITSACDHILQRWRGSPRIGIVLGTGLGALRRSMRVESTIPYDEIPHFCRSTALGHRGQLICGALASTTVLAMDGRFHLYEGYSASEVAFPLRVMRQLGTEVVIVSNASGGLHPGFNSGDVMVIEDHINFMWRNPLIGVNDEKLGPRFPDMCEPYDRHLAEYAVVAARQAGFSCHQGIYAAMTGPTYETRAEYRMLRRLGADAVGMSTVPETLVAVHAGMRVLGLSAITNLCRPDALESTSGEMVQGAAERAEPCMRQIVEGVVQKLEQETQ